MVHVWPEVFLVLAKRIKNKTPVITVLDYKIFLAVRFIRKFFLSDFSCRKETHPLLKGTGAWYSNGPEGLLLDRICFQMSTSYSLLFFYSTFIMVLD
jgi:hypothetical protein